MNTLLNLLFFNAYANSVAQLRQVAKRHDVADGEPGNDNLAGGGLGVLGALGGVAGLVALAPENRTEPAPAAPPP